MISKIGHVPVAIIHYNSLIKTCGGQIKKENVRHLTEETKLHAINGIELRLPGSLINVLTSCYKSSLAIINFYS